MKTKLKFILVVTLVATLLFSLVIFSSAEGDSKAVPDTVIPSGTYRFNEELTAPDFQLEDEYFQYFSNGNEYSEFFIYEELTDWVVSYVGYDAIDVYSSRSGWIDNAFRVITVPDDYTEYSQGFAKWFMNNTELYTPPSDEPADDGFSLYNGFYDLIVEYVYGNPTELDTAQHLVTTFFATIGSVTLVALPLICILWITKFLLSMIARF